MKGEAPLVKPVKRGFTVSYKGKTLLSTIDPVSQAERIAGSVHHADRTMYFCPSPLLGYGLDMLLPKISADSAVLCVETDAELFKISLSSIDKKILGHPHIAFTAVKDGIELCRFVREKWGPRAFRRIEVLKLSGGWQLDSITYESMAELLRSDIAVDWGNALTLIKLGRRFICNVIRNVPLLAHVRPIHELSFGSKPALVLGAGPSLDPLLDKMQEAGIFKTKTETENKNARPFALICVDTCLSLLKERGIVPDLTVILESQFWNQKDFSGSINSHIPAAVDISAYPGTVGLLGGPVYFFFTPWTPLHIFERLDRAGLLPPSLPPLGSVGLSAVELARRLGAGPIITAGIDFSYTLDSIHARSSPAHLSALLAQNRLKSFFNAETVFRQGAVNALSKSKNSVKSDPAMQNYRNLFEQEFSGGRIKDIEGSGLPLGLETLAIEEAIKALMGKNTKQDCVQTDPIGKTKHSGKFDELHDRFEKNKLSCFIKQEKMILKELLDFLSGSIPQEKPGSSANETLETLLDKADYLWAHFPDCAGTEGRRPGANDLVFLKRVRAEIDQFISLWELSEKLTGSDTTLQSF